MKKTLREAWKKALLSGKYKQGNHALRTIDNKFCCLGVLCEVAKIRLFAPSADNPLRSYSLKSGLHGTLDKELLLKIGMSSEQMSNFVHMNDSMQYTFEQIAQNITKVLNNT